MQVSIVPGVNLPVPSFQSPEAMAANGHEDFPPPATNTPASDADFKRFISLADSDEGWEEKYSTPESGVWTRQEKGSSINMLKVTHVSKLKALEL